jgi:hypothetical protein
VTEDVETSSRQPVEDDIPSAAGQQPAGDDASAWIDQPAAALSSIQERAAAIANERPEVAAGAAFAGGFLVALILRRIAR